MSEGHSTPARERAGKFFNSLLNGKDSSDSTPATPAPADESHARGKGRGGAPGPTGEDMQLLMDQLSQLSQSLADSQMAKKEFQDLAQKAEAAQKAAEAELALQLKKADAQAGEMSKLRDKVSFAALDATNEQLKQARAEAAEAKAENEALKDQNRILFQNYADINTELQTMHEALESKTAALAQMTTEKEELAKQLHALEMERADAEQTVAELRAALAEAEANAERTRNSLAELEQQQLAAAHKQARVDAERLTEELHAMTTDRNRLRALNASIQAEQKKLGSVLAARQREATTMAQDNQRLREDLARKSKSLQDALTALAVAMEAPPAAGSSAGSSSSAASSGARTPHAPETIIVAAPSSSMKVSGKDFASLQLLCTRLSEACAEKDHQLGVLKKQCVGLGKRVIELEAGTMPDFSDEAVEQRLQQQEAERQKRADEEAASLSIPMSSPDPAEIQPSPEGPLSPAGELLRSPSVTGVTRPVRDSSDGSTVALVSHSLAPTTNARPDYSGTGRSHKQNDSGGDSSAFPSLYHGAVTPAQAAAALALASPGGVPPASSPGAGGAVPPLASPPRSRAGSTSAGTSVKARSRAGSGSAAAAGLSIVTPNASASPPAISGGGSKRNSLQSGGGLTPSKPLSASIAHEYLMRAGEKGAATDQPAASPQP